MQTFLPYASPTSSARVLDSQRLGKQRVETLQIMNALTVPGYGWQNHPAVRMWRGYESALLDYQIAVCYEWHNVRGYKDTCLDKTVAVWSECNSLDQIGGVPPWLGDEALHASHRSNLLRKNEEWYRQFEWTEPSDLEYVWPV